MVFQVIDCMRTRFGSHALILSALRAARFHPYSKLWGIQRASFIKDYIFCSDELDYHWDELDDFEGEEYKRILIKVKTKDKMAVEAYIYILRES